MFSNDMKHTIVVGVDGSDSSRRALVWALDEARDRHLQLLLVEVVDLGLAAASPYSGGAFAELREAGSMALDQEVAFARDRGVPVEGRLELATPANALVEASKGAALLVVGSRGRGGLTGMLLGSVSTACVHHAHCPVVVIPAPDRHTEQIDHGSAVPVEHAVS